MRPIAFVLLLFITACSGAQELATSTSSATADESPTSTTADVATTAMQESTTTTTEPVTTTTLPELQSIAYQEVAEMPFPVEVTALPGSSLSYIATKDGRIWSYDGEAVSDTPVMDISARVTNSGEQGLLSIALHPEDARRLFVHYSAGDGDTVVSEFDLISETEADPSSERVLLRLDQPAGNHNGGMIMFGPEGLLFLGLGDGGAANDRFGNGQNQETLLGGLVTLSVDGDPDPTLFNYGLRNPWRFWLDDGLAYIADVGQNTYEEVSVAPIEPGLNFGWPITEGLHCFDPPSGCDTGGITLPVIEVEHGDAGSCSITGGILYRGTAIPEIRGEYFYSDYCGGYLRSFHLEDGSPVATDWTDQVGTAGAVTGFGVDGAGEMYVATTDALLKVIAIRG